MAELNYPQARTALLFVAPYNDFLSEGGKLWPYVRTVAAEVGLHANLRAVLAAARRACIESTGRFAMELGYHVTLVRDATAAFSRERMHAAHELNGPSFAHAIVTTAALVAALVER